MRKYSEAIEIAAKLQFSYEEFLCRLPLVCILGAKGNLVEAASHLARAQFLISDRSDRLVFRFREILFNLWQKRYSDDHALLELDALVESFGDMGLLQEQGAVILHRADIRRRLGKPDYADDLDKLQALSVSLQNQAFLAREWTLLPELHKVAVRSHPRIAGERKVVLEVMTLGQECLVLGRKPVNIPLRRGVEVLAYFLEHKAVTLKKLLAEIFPDQKPRSAKSYFHQFRHQLRENIDGLEIEYDSESKMYRLKSEIDILWDVSELRAGRVMGETGLFLPGSGNEWALVVEQGLDPYREAIGALATA